MFNYKEIEKEINNLRTRNNNNIQQPSYSNSDINSLFFNKKNNIYSNTINIQNKSMLTFSPSKSLKKYLENNDLKTNNIENNIEENIIKINNNNKSFEIIDTNTNNNINTNNIKKEKDYLKIYENFVKENIVVKLLLNRDLEGLKNVINGKIII